jgi:branched-chain amino acid transport system ATP-binding protein
MDFLSIENIHVNYGAVKVLHGISFRTDKGNIVSVLGPNGAGKTTLLRAILGLQKVSFGKIIFEGRDITNKKPEQIATRGISLVPEGRRCFPSLTVRENLEMGYWLQASAKEIQRGLERIYELFPVLKERLRQKAGTLSGGEQGMLAVARGILAAPELLCIDEPSLGLAPLIVEKLMSVFKVINEKDGISILLVEQNANLGLKLSHHAYLISSGEIAGHGPSAELLKSEHLQRVYFGTV